MMNVFQNTMSDIRHRRQDSASSQADLIAQRLSADNDDDDDEGVDVMDTGTLETISQQYESLDYFTNFNSLLLDEIRRRGYKFVIKKDIQRWLIMLSIGVITALIACCINITIEVVAEYKYHVLKEWTDHCVMEEHDCLYLPYLMWVALNVCPVLIGSFLIAYIEPGDTTRRDNII